jgi:hypothetical protein
MTSKGLSMRASHAEFLMMLLDNGLLRCYFVTRVCVFGWVWEEEG